LEDVPHQAEQGGVTVHPLKQLMWLKIGLGEKEDYSDYTDPFYAECAKRMFPRQKGQITLTRSYSMNDDDMSFMREVFMPDTQGNDKPKLPFNQYIVEWGLHRVSQEVNTATGGGGALADMRRKYGNHFQCRYSIPRPDGEPIKVSVISGMMFYSRKDAPYEVMIDGGSDRHMAYQTDEDLMLLLAKLLNEGDGHGLSK
jgi:hypothetical protein